MAKPGVGEELARGVIVVIVMLAWPRKPPHDPVAEQRMAELNARVQTMGELLARAQSQLQHTVHERLDAVTARLGDSMRTNFPAFLLILCCVMFALRFVSTPREAVFLMAVAGAAHDFGQGANWATIVDIGGRYAGIAAGLINTVGNMGHFAQPPLGAWIFHKFGWNSLFATYACFYLIAACCAVTRVLDARHFPTDIYAGAILGTVVARCVLAWEKKRCGAPATGS